MINCANPYILELNSLDGNSFVASQQVAELTREASVSELLESLGADCLEIRFNETPVWRRTPKDASRLEGSSLTTQNLARYV